MPFPVPVILHVRRVRLEPPWDWDLRSPFWRLYSNDRTGAVIAGRGWAHALLPRVWHLVPPWLTATGRCTRAVQHDFLHFRLDGLPLAMQPGVHDRPLALPIDDPTLTERIFSSGTAVPHWPALRLLCTVLERAAGMPLLAAALQPLPAPPPTAPAIRRIEQAYGRPLDTAQLAATCGLSEHQLRRQFRRYHGTTPHRYLHQVRVRAAAEMLLGSKASIDAVAEQCGFANRFHFTRIFSAQMGQPPAAFRRAGWQQATGDDASAP